MKQDWLEKLVDYNNDTNQKLYFLIEKLLLNTFTVYVGMRYFSLCVKSSHGFV